MHRLLLVFLVSALLSPIEAALHVAIGGRANVEVVIAAGAILPERTAAYELATYLKRVTGDTFPVVAEPLASGGPAIHVGPTALARSEGLSVDELGPETWVHRSSGDTLILCGGRPRGTLYAVYRFLEDHVGVRWWSPWEEFVPQRKTLSLPELDTRGEPVFVYRDLHGGDGPRAFFARNRVNGHSTPQPASRGGYEAFGPPYFVHTFRWYIDPEVYFESHPEYFSERDGKRRGGRSQLCLTSEALGKLLLEKLQASIRQGTDEAREEGLPPPRFYDFSPNDWRRSCRCESCSALTEEQRSPSAPLVQRINHLAEALAEEHPDVLLATLAYDYYFHPSRTLALRENVVLRLSALQRRDFTKPVSHPVHEEYRDAIGAWRSRTRHLWIWDYAVTYGKGATELPLPNLRIMAADLAYYADHGVEGIFIQQDYPIFSDLRDLKRWMLVKWMEDPRRDYDALLRDFTDGFYGPAGGTIRRYLADLERAMSASGAEIRYPAEADRFRYLDAPFLLRAQRTFERAEAKVARSPLFLRRVRHARLPIDRATLILGADIAEGGPWPSREDLQAVARRFLETWDAEVELREPGGRQEARREEGRAQVEKWLGNINDGASPEPVKARPSAR